MQGPSGRNAINGLCILCYGNREQQAPQLGVRAQLFAEMHTFKVEYHKFLGGARLRAEEVVVGPNQGRKISLLVSVGHGVIEGPEAILDTPA